MGDRRGGTRRSRWLGVVHISIARLRKRTAREASGWSTAVIWMVAITIAILLIVTGVAIALADDGAVTNDDADVHIIPADRGTLTTIDGIESARLGETGDRAAQIRAHDGVDHASPLLVETVAVLPPEGDEPVRVLAVGITPGENASTVAGLSTTSLTVGDPDDANEAADGAPPDVVVLSSAAATRLDADVDDQLTIPDWSVGSIRTYTVIGVEEPVDSDRDVEVPLALMHLETLQSLSGADDDQLADRMLVWGDAGPATAAAEDAYPGEEVTASDDRTVGGLFADQLAFATSAIALVVGVVVCSLFVATTAGMAVDSDRKTLAIFESIGFPLRSRLAIISITTVVTTLSGALLGVVLGVGGIYALNTIARATITTSAIAHVHPLFLPYAFAIAIVAGILALPYPLVIAARTDILEEFGR